MTDLLDIANDLLTDFADDLWDTDEQVCHMISESNADGWGFDVVDDIKLTLNQDGSHNVSATIYLVGDQIDDQSDLGDQITIDFNGKLVRKLGQWALTRENLSNYRINDEDVDDEDDIDTMLDDD